MAKKLERLGFIGDIHAEDVLLERAIFFLEARGVDAIATTGDLVDGTGDVNKCCALAESRNVIAVRGNHDRWLLDGTARSLPNATQPEAISAQSRAFLTRMPRTVQIDTLSGLALLCHGIGPNDMVKVGPDDAGYALESNDDLQNLLHDSRYRWLLNGHSHRAMVRHFGSLSVLNAGTLKSDEEPTFLEIDFRAGEVSQFTFDDNGTIREQSVRSPLTIRPTVRASAITPQEVMSRYARGVRNFRGMEIQDSASNQGFRDCLLDEADFTGAFVVADFSGASLRNACFRRSNLKACHFSGCNLAGSDFRGARFDGAAFEGACSHGRVLGPGETPDW